MILRYKPDGKFYIVTTEEGYRIGFTVFAKATVQIENDDLDAAFQALQHSKDDFVMSYRSLVDFLNDWEAVD